MPQLTTLPNEILHNIFQWLPPKDLGSLPRVCRALHSYVKDNQKLCHDIYLHHFVSIPEILTFLLGLSKSITDFLD